MIRQSIKDESEIILFGKYRHCTVQYILKTEPSYVLWLHENKIVEFTKKILDLAEDMNNDRLEDRLHGSWGWDGFEGE